MSKASKETKPMYCGLELLGMPAKIAELAKEYKITGLPIDGSNTDSVFNQFKYIPVEVIQLKPSGGKKSLASSMLHSPCAFSCSDIKGGERFTIHPVKEIAPLYYLFNYISNEEEQEALKIDSIKEYAIYLKYEKSFFWRNFFNYELMEVPEMSSMSVATYFDEGNDRLITKKAIKTFCKVGDMIADEVEVGMPQSSIPHGYVDLMVVSLLFQSPPVCFFNFMEYKFYHCTTASFKNPQSFAQEASDRQVIAELLSVYENLNSTCETIVILKADRCRLQPFIYVPSLDVLLRTKCPVVFRRENGRPEVVGCLLLYFLLRHSSMISVINIKASCNAMNIRDARCGWKQAVDTIKEDNRRIRLQKWPTMHEQRLPTSCSDKTMEEKFGGVCKSLLERVKDATQ